MTDQTHIRTGLPDLNRTDVSTVRVSDDVTDAGSVFTALAQGEWPTELLSFNAYVNTESGAVLTYTQWGGEGADLTRAPSVEYRPYRSGTKDDAPTPGCIVVVRVEFEGPDEQRQRDWIDTVFQALDAQTTPHPGGISGHFHVSTDGTKALNYAEWTTEEAHKDALAQSGQGTVGKGPLWQKVLTFPGVKAHGFQRYTFQRGLSRT
jgi:hypothetical protein